MVEKTLNLLGIEPCFSIRYADGLTGGPMVLSYGAYRGFIVVNYIY